MVKELGEFMEKGNCFLEIKRWHSELAMSIHSGLAQGLRAQSQGKQGHVQSCHRHRPWTTAGTGGAAATVTPHEGQVLLPSASCADGSQILKSLVSFLTLLSPNSGIYSSSFQTRRKIPNR